MLLPVHLPKPSTVSAQKSCLHGLDYMIKFKLFPDANQWIPENAFCYVFLGWKELLTKITCILELLHTSSPSTPLPQGSAVAAGYIQAGARWAQQAPIEFIRYIAVSHFLASHATIIIQLLAIIPDSCTQVTSPSMTGCGDFQAVSLSSALSLAWMVEMLCQGRAPAKSSQNCLVRLGPTPEWVFS